eukprot:1392376-Amorphochlora_amoeboformis.AAC.2
MGLCSSSDANQPSDIRRISQDLANIERQLGKATIRMMKGLFSRPTCRTENDRVAIAPRPSLGGAAPIKVRVDHIQNV